MLRIFGAVGTGYVLIGVLVVLTDQLFAWLIPGLRSTSSPPMKYLVSVLFTDCVWTVLGGYVCARIARGSWEAPVGLILFGELLGIGSAIVSWANQPHWFAITLLIVYPAAIWAGYKLSGAANAATSST